MSRLDIEDWEKVTAEVEMRRWLAKMGLWDPGVDMEKWRTTEEAEAVEQEQREDERAEPHVVEGAVQAYPQHKPITPAAKGASRPRMDADRLRPSKTATMSL